MQLPFTTYQFIEMFRDYNRAIGPLPVFAYLLGMGAVCLAFMKTRWSSRAIALVLASFWGFTGIAYHLMSFSAINPAARFFGIAFIAEAVLFALSAIRSSISFGYSGDVKSKIGLGIVAWSMVGYPLAGAFLGHGYPSGPVFALTPCPLLLFTFGMLLMADRMPKYLVSVPIMWTVVGTTAAFKLGIFEDLTLALSAITFLVVRATSARENRPSRTSRLTTSSAPRPLPRKLHRVGR